MRNERESLILAEPKLNQLIIAPLEGRNNGLKGNLVNPLHTALEKDLYTPQTICLVSSSGICHLIYIGKINTSIRASRHN